MKSFTTSSATLSFAPATNELVAQQPSDEELMAAIQQGDASALGTLMHRYRRLLRSTILRTVIDDAAADDVLQECFLQLWRKADQYSPTKGPLLAWLMTLGKRRAIDYLRSSMAYCRAKDRLEESIQQTYTITMNSAMESERADIRNVLGEHLILLPLAQKQVIEMAFLQGMSQREVAEATNTPLGTVKTRMELGMKKLRQTFRTRSAFNTFRAA